MNFLRKILLIAIISVFTGNAKDAQAAEQIIFDLPDNTPGLVKFNSPLKDVCGIKKECVQIVVEDSRNYELVKALNEDNLGVGWSDIESDKCIYFPADGTQPTTKEAVEYSCANVNDDAITNWYMMMFGI